MFKGERRLIAYDNSSGRINGKYMQQKEVIVEVMPILMADTMLCNSTAENNGVNTHIAG